MNKRIIIKFLILLVGMLLSIILHELFHYIMHYGNIIRIDFFTNNNIVQVIAITPKDYNVLGEELVAYLITIIVMILTVILITRIKDKK